LVIHVVGENIALLHFSMDHVGLAHDMIHCIIAMASSSSTGPFDPT
jgi:hypothetical protein